MKPIKSIILIISIALGCFAARSQTTPVSSDLDSANISMLEDYTTRLAEIEQQRIADSIKRADLESQVKSLKANDNKQRQALLDQIRIYEEQEQKQVELKKARIDSLRANAKGYPVMGILNDTLFFIYSKLGSVKPGERAQNVKKRINILLEDDFLNLDSIIIEDADNTSDIIYKDIIITSVSETDAIWQNTTRKQLAAEYSKQIRQDLIKAREDRKLSTLLIRLGLALLVIFVTGMMIWLVGKGYKWLLRFAETNKSKWLKDLTYNDYTFLSADQEYKVVLFLVKIFRWFLYIVLLYIAVPVIFRIFPFTRGWGDNLFQLIWSPVKGIFVAVWEYLPNLFSILVIYFAMKYFIRFVKYLFSEVDAGKLKISGFHRDWAMPTFSIVKFLLYAFMFVLIFPYLPGSDSDIFKGVSVFVGILFSLGSSTAVANMVAGLVITYMRPFKIGDRIKIADVVGDVEEKSLLVTRIRTPKNEVITIPNSAVLSGNITNYSSEAKNDGLIIHSTVTIGYDVPWKEMHQALVDAALRTDMILKEPVPFVLQTSLDDFYVSYQINAYTREASLQAGIYSSLHQNIQDVCNERGIEIMSPHYRAARDGNTTTIPAGYLPKDYKAPSFSFKTDKK
jgi:small-conductance mechanosensitive channel